MIYFVERPDTKAIKIGTTNRLSNRHRILSREVGLRLNILGICKGGIVEEQALHQKFDHLNIKKEWFTPGPDLLAFIAEECQPWDGVDDIPNAKSVRIDGRLAGLAKAIAESKSMTVAEYLSNLLERPISKDYVVYMKDIWEKTGGDKLEGGD